MVEAATAGVILDIDGAMCGTVWSAQGGDGFAEVFEERLYDRLGDQLGKRISPPRWEDLELQFSLPLHRTVYDWIAASWRREYKPRTVRITAYDPALNIIRRREFPGALITETTVPTLNASSPELGLLKLKLRFDSVQTIPPSGTVRAPSSPRPWLGSNIRLDLPDLDCTKVMQIDSFTVNQSFAVKLTDAGQVTAPGPLSFPNLTVTLAESSAETWQAWFNNFVVEQRYGEEKTGRLTLLDGQLRERVRISLSNVGIFRLTSSPWTRDDSPRRVVAGLYCEQMDITVLL
jgi:hypothetical protein